MIQIDRVGSNLWITLARPEKRNAIASDIRTRICEALDLAERSEDVRAITIIGAGDAFCAGADLSELREARSAGTEVEVIEQNALMLEQWRGASKRTIAAVNGPAYGLGFLLAFHAKFVAATVDARFCMSEVKFGIRPRSTDRFVQRFGQARADALLKDACELGARDAAEWGLVNKVVADVVQLRQAATAAAMLAE
jgi:2-(1,2-epoxy-1,2-dihydrophenyl)acetyl-CoA isomerase